MKTWTILIIVALFVLAFLARRGRKKRNEALVALSKGVNFTITDVREGEGAEARVGKVVRVHYTGRLLDGRVFDSSRDRSEPFQFVLGAGRVIAGWEKGLVGMKVGGKRTLLIPPEMAYGKRGAGKAVPPNAALEFDVELLEVK